MIISTITGLQALLIGLGLLMEIVAISAHRAVSEGELELAPVADENDAKPVSPDRPNVIAFPRASKPSARDYYEMDDTPQGVPPAQLLRTAKVRYISNV